MNKNKLSMFHFLNGWADASGADDMSDGAWQAVMMEGVEAFNKEEGTEYDPHDGWLEWCQWEGDDEY